MLLLTRMIEKLNFGTWAEQQVKELTALYLPENPTEAAKVEPIVIRYILNRIKRYDVIDPDSDFIIDVIEGAQEKYINSSFTRG